MLVDQTATFIFNFYDIFGNNITELYVLDPPYFGKFDSTNKTDKNLSLEKFSRTNYIED